MKKFSFILALVAFGFIGASAQTLEFETVEIDYGVVEKGSNGVREFKFTNKGTAPLEITNAQGSCGCTVPTWPKEPIMPGQSSVVSAKYDTNRVGPFTKYITLTTNSSVEAQKSLKLTIKGEVKDAPAAVPASDQGTLTAPNH